MNANELADKLEDKDRLWNVDEKLMIKTCAMLRAQQAEIEALKLQVKGYQTAVKHYRKKADGDDDWKLTREYCS